MAKKAELLEKANELKLEVTAKNTIAEIEEAIKNADEKPKKTEDKPKATVAKAGKRSAKGIEEAEEKAEKISSQHHRDEEDSKESTKPKTPIKPTRPKHERKGKNYQAAYQLIDKHKSYSLEEAVKLAQETSKVKFDASVELHINLNVDPRQADQNIRGSLILPNGSGKTIKVAVFDDEKVDGADIQGVEAITNKLEKGEISFDVLIATPANMAKLGKYARLLGPRGLMPNPKNGTVTSDVAKALNEAKAGKVDYRVDSSGIIHIAVGKVSFSTDKLLENTQAMTASVRGAKPSSIKGNYINSIFITTSMGPSVKVDPSA